MKVIDERSGMSLEQGAPRLAVGHAQVEAPSVPGRAATVTVGAGSGQKPKGSARKDM